MFKFSMDWKGIFKSDDAAAKLAGALMNETLNIITKAHYPIFCLFNA